MFHSFNSTLLTQHLFQSREERRGEEEEEESKMGRRGEEEERKIGGRGEAEERKRRRGEEERRGQERKKRGGERRGSIFSSDWLIRTHTSVFGVLLSAPGVPLSHMNE